MCSVCLSCPKPAGDGKVGTSLLRPIDPTQAAVGPLAGADREAHWLNGIIKDLCLHRSSGLCISLHCWTSKGIMLQATHTLSPLNRHINVQEEGWNSWEKNSQYSSRCRVVTRHLGFAWQLLCRLPGLSPDLLIPDLQVEGRGAVVFHEPSSWFCCVPKFERQGPR